MLEYTIEKNGVDDFILETLDSYKEYDIFPKASDTTCLVGNFFGKHEIPGWLSLINEVFEDWTGIKKGTTDQHVELRETRIKRNISDVKKLMDCLELFDVSKYSRYKIFWVRSYW